MFWGSCDVGSMPLRFPTETKEVNSFFKRKMINTWAQKLYPNAILLIEHCDNYEYVSKWHLGRRCVGGFFLIFLILNHQYCGHLLGL